RVAVVGLLDAEEGPRLDRAGWQRNGLRLKRRTRRLVLKADRRKRSTEGNVALLCIAPRRAHELQEIRGITNSALTTAMRYPGMPAALRKILARHENRTHAGMVPDMMIEVLAGVGFVVHQEPGVPEAEVRNEQRVAPKRLLAPIAHLHEPQPEILICVQLQTDLVRNPAELSVPEEAFPGRPNAAARLRARDRQDHWLDAADAQVQPAHASGNRRAQGAVHHDPAALLQVLHGEDRTVGQEGDLKPGLVPDPPEVQIVRAWCGQELLLHGTRHSSRLAKNEARTVAGAALSVTVNCLHRLMDPANDGTFV